MMSKKRFELANFSVDIIGIKDNEYDAFILDEDVVDKLNEQEDKIHKLSIKWRVLSQENEQLRKQIQNYEKLIANSYVGEEERLDGFFGRYVIWEDELQKYKNKNEMIGDE